MEQDLVNAKQLLEQENCTCVLCKAESVYRSQLRGVRPLLDFLDNGTVLEGFCAADKVVGKGAAFLYCLLSVRAVYAPVMSKAAKAVLQDHGIRVYADVVVDAIFNHRRDGFCPMETATQHICDPREALCAIRQTMEALRKA